MKRVIAIATATTMTVLMALTISVAAQMPDTRDRTIMTFSGGVELPGMRLDAGTYVFRIGDTPSRNVIQVLSGDEKDMLGQWLFVPAERPEATGDTVITFRETTAASTPAVQFWYYPGERTGKEFIYPKDQAMRIAQRTGVAVLSDGGRIEAGAQASTQTTQPISAQAEVAVAPAEGTGAGMVRGNGMPDTRVETVGTTGTVEQAPATSGTGSVRQEATYAQNELPRTASPLPLSGLIALLSLAGAAGIRKFRL